MYCLINSEHFATYIVASIVSNRVYIPPIFKMHRNLVLALSLSSLSLPAVASPLQAREADPGLIDALLGGVLIGIPKLIKDVLSGTISAIDDTRSNKPLTCSLSILSDKCCVCKSTNASL